jgi:hypothetical protein
MNDKTTVMNKTDYVWTLATLLSLDHSMKEDLMKLSEDTLAKMYVNYIQNAKDSNHAIERANAHQSKLTPCGNKGTCSGRVSMGSGNTQNVGNKPR